MKRKTLLLITFLAEGGLFLIGLLLIGYSSIEIGTKFNISWGATAYALLLCIPMLAVMYIVSRSEWPSLVRLNREIEEKIAPLFKNCKLIDLAAIAFLAGLGEELFFRGWLQGILTSRFDVWLGILLTSVIFGLAHYLSKEYALYAGLTGIYLGMIYQISGNLYIVMTVHAVYDFVALIYLVQSMQNNVQEFTPPEIFEK